MHTLVITELIFSPPDFNNSPVILSTPGDLPLYSDCIAYTTSLLKIGYFSLYVSSVAFSIDVSLSLLKLYNSEQYSVHLIITPFLSLMKLSSLF